MVGGVCAICRGLIGIFANLELHGSKSDFGLIGRICNPKAQATGDGMLSPVGF